MSKGMFVHLKGKPISKVINLAHVAYAERVDETGNVTLHFAMPPKKDLASPTHFAELFLPPEADIIWKQLQSL